MAKKVKKVNRKKGPSKVVKAGKVKHDPKKDSKMKRQGTAGQRYEKEDKDIWNRADSALNSMIKNKGIPRHKVIA